MTRRIVLTLAGIGLLVPGCMHEPPAPFAGEVEVRPIDASGLAQAIETHRGQVVLIDFWATWCEPCVELFPHTVELHRQFHDRGLAVITVSLDDPDSAPAVRKFLAASGATMENFLSVYGIGSAAVSAFSIDNGALPCLRLYARDGKLRRTFASGGKAIDPAEVERAVKEMVE